MVSTLYFKKLYMLEKSINDTRKQLFTKYFSLERCKWFLNVNTKVAKYFFGGRREGYSFCVDKVLKDFPAKGLWTQWQKNFNHWNF